MRLKILIFTVILTTCYGCNGINNQITPVNLRTEYLAEPLGIDAKAPRFTWDYEGSDYYFTTSKYEILIGKDSVKVLPYTTDMVLEPHTRYYWKVRVWDGKNRPCKDSKFAWFETAKMNPGDWSAKWIRDDHDQEFEPAPMFRKTFSTEDKQIASARMYIAAAGYYETFVNGQRVGRNYLDPGYTHFDKRILYVTHDVTDLMQNGNNAITTVLGNGWYNVQSVAVWDFEKASWRNRPRMMCELRVNYTDGSTQIVASDESWKTTTGPYTYNNIYSGDRYDARLEASGWKNADFDDNSWKQSIITESPAPLIVAQQMPAIHITKEFTPTAMKSFGDKIYVYSFPKNMSGVCRLKVKGEAGTRISIRYGELLKTDGRLEQGNIDVYYHPVKPGEVHQTDEFILKGTGDEEIFMPSFSYHGFQYVEVESSQPITLTESSLTALFLHTDVTPTGSFSCSNETLNRIWDATMQAYLSNLHSIPTDCPQREKNGWTADAHVAADLALLGFDGITVYEKWMNDFIDNQRKETNDISGIIPSGGAFYNDWIGPVWDAAMFIIPNAIYNYYGDSRCIENLYPTMERYLAYLKTKEKEGYLAYGLGDWLPWKAQTPNEYTSTAYYYHDYVLMARFAEILGKDPTPYHKKADEIKSLINNKFYDSSTGVYANGTQTAQGVALYLGLVPDGDEQKVADVLRKLVVKNNHFLDFGLLGSKTVPRMLTKYGYVEDAMKMVTKTEAPSWGYWTDKMGYTTLAETWTLSPEFRDASLNHVFMGDVSAWMMNQLAGINFDESRPGFSRILITPHFVKDLDWVKGEYSSVKGLIRSEWKRENKLITLKVSIPFGCSADVIIRETKRTIFAGEHTMYIR